MSTTPIRVAVTGAAGQIGYALVFRIASGAMFGPDQPVILHLIEIEPALPALNGVVMELDDCAFPLLKGVVPTADPKEGFNGVNWNLLVGARPRGKGMERGDLLSANGKIFGSEQGVERGELALEGAERSDAGLYTCVPVGGTPAETTLRVKDQFAALWPFLGICAEVFVLCAIILVYERRRTKPELDDSDTDNHEQKKS